MPNRPVKPNRDEQGPRTKGPDDLVRGILAEYRRQCGHQVVACANTEDVLIILPAGQKIDVVRSPTAHEDFDATASSPSASGGCPTAAILRMSKPRDFVNELDELFRALPPSLVGLPPDVIRRIDRLRQRRRRYP